MSSFIGHSLAGLTTYAITQQIQGDRPNESSFSQWKWLIWLLVVASIPDIDYLIPAWRVQQAHQTLRVTHSLLGVILIPGCTILGLWLLGKRKKLQIAKLTGDLSRNLSSVVRFAHRSVSTTIALSV